MDINNDIVTVRLEGESFEEVMDDIEKEIQLKNYRVIRIINVDSIKMRRNLVENLEIAFENYKVIEFCNLFTCNELITPDLRAGVFMPQKFVVYQRPGDKNIIVSYLKPTSVARLFGSKKMMKPAEKMEKDMEEILDSVDF